jgi:hypothetical protein
VSVGFNGLGRIYNSIDDAVLCIVFSTLTVKTAWLTTLKAPFESILAVHSKSCSQISAFNAGVNPASATYVN